MKANVRKVLFVLTIMILGIGVGIALIHDRYKKHKPYEERLQVAKKLLLRHNNLKHLEKMDLSSDEDLTVAVMNLLSIEEHLFFTGAKTKKKEYYDLINEVRKVRKSLLKKLVPRYEGEVWCISKHLLAASYRLMETGTKQLHQGNKKEAYELFDYGYQLYLKFWKINAVNLQASPTNNKPLFAGIDKGKSANTSADIKKLKMPHGRIGVNVSNTNHSAPHSCIFDSSKINCCNE